MIFLDFCFFSNSIRYFLGHPIDCWLYWWVLPRYTRTFPATTRWSAPRREPVVCNLWQRWKRDHHLPLHFILLFQNIFTDIIITITITITILTTKPTIIITNSNPGASDHHRLVRRARHRWAVRRRHGKARRLSRLSWILNISFAHFCQFLMFSYWAFFTNMLKRDPLALPDQYKF